MKEPITVTSKQVEKWDIERLASALLDVVEQMPTAKLVPLAAVGRRLRTEIGGGEAAKGSAA